jgi:hypothetical protein
VNPEVKRLATEVVQLVGTWSSGESGLRSAKRRLAAAGHDPGIADSLTDLLPSAEEAVTQIVNAQYGGILASSASVLAVVRQWYLSADDIRHEHGTTFDIRLAANGNRWHVTQIRPADPGPAVTGLSEAARAVLVNPRLHLPEACLADIRSGRIHDSVLSALSTLSRRHVLDVSILRSGHPYHVFGTNRVSDHPRGRAVDVWAVDGHPIVVPANRARTVAFMREASATGPWQVGGPVDLDGAAKAYFSDPTHHDHVHLGFRS